MSQVADCVSNATSPQTITKHKFIQLRRVWP